jgi:TRAP-type C4-dicarboxylate transport system substrate-binding protein
MNNGRRDKTVKKRILLIPLALLLVMSLVVVGCPAPTPPAVEPVPPAEPIVLEALVFQPVTAPRMQIFAKLVDHINERAKGELIIEILGGPEVMGGFEQAVAVRDGVIDMSLLPTSMYEGIIPTAEMIMFSELSAEEERQTGAWDYLRKLHEEGGLFFLGRADPSNEPQFFMISTVRTDSIKDFAGLKAGATATTFDVFMTKALGMSFSIIPFAEAYTAMSGGVVDVYSFPPESHVAAGLHEIGKYVVDIPLFVCNTVIIMNQNTWNQLPEHLRELIMDAYIEFEPNSIALHLEMKAKAREAMIDAGVEFIELPPDESQWFVETAYRVEWDHLIKMYPVHGPALYELLTRR